MRESELGKFQTNLSKFDVLDNLDGSNSVHKMSHAPIERWNKDVVSFLDFLVRNPHPRLLMPEGFNGSPGQLLHEFYPFQHHETLDHQRFALLKVIHEGLMKEDDLVRLMTQLAGAAAHIHRQGFIHTDIKPLNVFVDLNKHDVDLILFDYNSITKPYLQLHGIRRMILEYPPELDQDHVWIDSRFDVYSIGRIFYDLTHDYIFKYSAYSPIDGLNPNHPLFAIIDKCMANPDERYPDAGAVLSDLQMI